MNRSRIAAVCIALAVSVSPSGVLARARGSVSHQAGPAFVFPANGQTFPYRGPYLFQVQSVSGAIGYLWTFSQNGMIAWQNLDATGSLSGATMSIKGGGGAQRHLHPGALQVRVRAETKGGAWTSASTITVQLTGGPAVAPTKTPASPPAGSPTKAPSGPPPAGTVLYETTWSSGHENWTLPQGWDTVNSQLVNDGTIGDIGRFAQPPTFGPYTPNYAVQADIQMVRGGGTSLCGANFGLITRRDGVGFYTVGMDANWGNGWIAAIADNTAGSGCISLANTNLAKSSFSVDNAWHTYRAEVRGNDIRLLIDGNPIVETTDNHHLKGSWVGIWSLNTVINVRNFKVTAL